MASGPISSTPGPVNTSAQLPSISWEGDKMFNIYIFDYCNKRGFHETAKQLMVEAEIPPESQPPINAKQGLLFEWWSVFWVLFTAKSSGSGTDDAMLYIQQQSQQAAQKSAQARMQQPPPINRFMNGLQRAPGAMPPNGMIPNGTGPASLQNAMPNGNTALSFPLSGPGSQQNGIPGTSAGPSAPGSAPPQPGNFQSLRASGPQQRGPAPGPPFQSPTMAHSPQTLGGGPQQQQPMSQLGPSPHMAPMQRGMLPPNGAQGSQQASNPAFQNLQRPPSRTASPSNMQPSPSMTARQPPSSAQEANLNNELSKLPPSLLTSCRQEIGLADVELTSLNLESKQRLVSMAKQRMNNAAAGPSMQAPNQRNQQRPGPPPPPQQRGNKRNSTSPAEEHEMLPKNEASPPDRKRPRRSPLNSEQAPPMNSMGYPQQPQQGGGPGGPQQMANGMMRPMSGPPGGPLMNGYPQTNMGNMGNMNNNPGMNNPMQQYREQQYRQTMQTLHKSNAMAAASPPSGDPSFGPGPGPQGPVPSFSGGGGGLNNRMNQNKAMGMRPPPSPASGGPKDQSGKDKGGRPDSSPRNAPNSGQGPQNSGNPGQGGTAPATPNSNPMAVPSPSAVLGNPAPPSMNPTQSIVPPPQPDMTDLFSGGGFSMPLDDFTDTTLTKGFEVDFERDFGQWFNSENDVPGI